MIEHLVNLFQAAPVCESYACQIEQGDYAAVANAVCGTVFTVGLALLGMYVINEANTVRLPSYTMHYLPVVKKDLEEVEAAPEAVEEAPAALAVREIKLGRRETARKVAETEEAIRVARDTVVVSEYSKTANPGRFV